MRKHIVYYLVVALLMHTGVKAQNPALTTFSVSLKTDEGRDTIININGVDKGSFMIWGSNGNVTNPLTGKTTQEQNMDLFGWIENLDYSSTDIKSLPSSLIMQYHDITDAGYCISKNPNPTVSDSVVSRSKYEIVHHYYDDSYWWASYTYYMELFDIQEHHNAETSYTLHCNENKNVKNMFKKLLYAQISGLEYMTTYYVRPYIVFNGTTMYGGEISFTTPRTKVGASLNEPDMKEWSFMVGDVILNIEALKTLLGNKIEITDAIKTGIGTDLSSFFAYDMLERLKTFAYREIECSDGTLYAVQDIPVDMVNKFQEYLYGEYSFSPAGNVIENGTKLPGSSSNITNSLYEIETIECDPEWDVPYNSYVSFSPSNSTAVLAVGINIPKYMLPQTYDIYAVFVNPDLENDSRRYRFYTEIWEQDEQGDYSGKRMTQEDRSYTIVTTDSVVCDTVQLGRYTFSGYPETIIQFVSSVSSSYRSEFKNSMCISQITFVPVKEEDE